MPKALATTWTLLTRAWEVFTTIWCTIRDALQPVVGPAVRPIQRWDDRRLARQMLHDADWLELISPDAARKLRSQALDLWEGAR